MRMKSALFLMTCESANVGESEPLSNRVDGHHVSAPEIPTTTTFLSFFALSNAVSSCARLA